MTNLLTNVVLALSVYLTTKTNQPVTTVKDAPACTEPGCAVVHHSIESTVTAVVEQRWLLGRVDGKPIELLLSEKTLSEPTTVRVVLKFNFKWNDGQWQNWTTNKWTITPL